MTTQAKHHYPYNKRFVALLIATESTGFAQWEYVLATSNAVLSYLGDYIFPGISTMALSLIAAILVVGAMIGALSGGPLSARYGRRKMLLIGDMISIVGALLCMVEVYPIMIIGRIVQGLNVGLNSSIASNYTAEMVPNQIRGMAGVINMTVMNTGMCCAIGLGFLVPNEIGEGEVNNGWRVVYIFATFFALIRIVLFLFFQKHETPAFYVSKYREQEALEMLKKIYTCDPKPILDQLVKDRDYLYKSSVKQLKYKDLLSKKYRKAYGIGLYMVFLHQFAGIGAIYAFSVHLFRYGIDDPNDSFPLTMTMILSIISVIFSAVAGLTIERFGRRKQFLPSIFMLGVVCLAYSIIVLADGPENMGAKVMLLLWPVFFSLCMGSLTFLYLGEVLPDIAISAVTPFNWIGAFIVAQVFLSLLESIGPQGVLFIFAGTCFTGFFVMYFHMVESKGRTKAQMISLYSGIPEDEIKTPAVENQADIVKVENGDGSNKEATKEVDSNGDKKDVVSPHKVDIEQIKIVEVMEDNIDKIDKEKQSSSGASRSNLGTNEADEQNSEKKVPV